MSTDHSAAIGVGKTVDLKMSADKVSSTASLTPFDAASLARELLSTAVATLSTPTPVVGSMIASADIPVYQTQSRLDPDGRIVIELSIPIDPGIGFTFRLAPNVAGYLSRELSRILQDDTPDGAAP